MGLMRGAFESAKLDGSSFWGANMARVMMEFASLRRADASLCRVQKQWNLEPELRLRLW